MLARRAPLVILGLNDIGGWGGLTSGLANVATSQGYAAGTWSESWRHMGSVTENPMGIEWFGMVMGLGVVLSFGYWCTNFLVVQRAMAAKNMTSARNTPLIAAVPAKDPPALAIWMASIDVRLAAVSTSVAGAVPV